MKLVTPEYLKKVRSDIDSLEAKDPKAAVALKRVYESALSRIEGYETALTELEGIESILNRYGDAPEPVKTSQSLQKEKHYRTEPNDDHKRILELLGQSELDGSQIVEKTNAKPNAVSSRLGYLLQRGLIEKVGGTIRKPVYRLSNYNKQKDIPEAKTPIEHEVKTADNAPQNIDIFSVLGVLEGGTQNNQKLHEIFNSDTRKLSNVTHGLISRGFATSTHKPKRIVEYAITEKGKEYLKQRREGKAPGTIILNADLENYKPVLDILKDGPRPLLEIMRIAGLTKGKLGNAIRVLSSYGKIKIGELEGVKYAGLPEAILIEDHQKPKNKIDRDGFELKVYVDRYFNEHPQTESVSVGSVFNYINENIGRIDRNTVTRSVKSLEGEFNLVKVPEGKGALKNIWKIARREKIVQVEGIPIRERYLTMLEEFLSSGMVIERNDLWAQLNEPNPESVDKLTSALEKHFSVRGLTLHKDERGGLHV